MGRTEPIGQTRHARRGLTLSWFSLRTNGRDESRAEAMHSVAGRQRRLDETMRIARRVDIGSTCAAPRRISCLSQVIR